MDEIPITTYLIGVENMVVLTPVNRPGNPGD